MFTEVSLARLSSFVVVVDFDFEIAVELVEKPEAAVAPAAALVDSRLQEQLLVE